MISAIVVLASALGVLLYVRRRDDQMMSKRWLEDQHRRGDW